jgi:serine/threonine protein kinase
MELLPMSLHEYLRRHPEVRSDHGQILLLLTQLASVVTQLHRRRVAHRDLKPRNVMVNREGNLKLTDFDLAHIHREDEPMRTQRPTYAGTVRYMPPELHALLASFLPAAVLSAASGPADASSSDDGGGLSYFAADIWSLGCCFIEIITGTAPFAGLSREQLQQLLCEKD